MKRALRAGAAVALAVALAAAGGCYKVSYRTEKPAAGPHHERWSHFFLWGLVNTSTVNVAKRCADGLSYLEIRNSVGTWMISTLTLGLYSPLVATVHCAGPGGPPGGAVSASTGASRGRTP